MWYGVEQHVLLTGCLWLWVVGSGWHPLFLLLKETLASQGELG